MCLKTCVDAKKGKRAAKTLAVFHVYGDLSAQCFEPDVKNFINVIEEVKINDIFVGELIVEDREGVK